MSATATASPIHLSASVLIATIGLLITGIVAPEWGHALPALLIAGTTVPL